MMPVVFLTAAIALGASAGPLDTWLDLDSGGRVCEAGARFADELSRETGRRVRVVPLPADEDGWKSLRRGVRGVVWCPDEESCPTTTNLVSELHARFDAVRIALRQPELRLYFSELTDSSEPRVSAWNEALARFDMEEPKAEMVPVGDLVALVLRREYGRRDVKVAKARPLPVVPAAQFDPIGWVERRLAAGERQIVVPAGQYDVDRTNGQYLVLKDLADVTIDFSGSLLRLRTHGMPFQLVGCRNVTIRNLTVDFPWTLPFAEGIIEKIGPDGEWDVRVAKGYCDAPSCGWPVQAYDRVSGQIVNPMRSPLALDVTSLGPGRIRIAGGKKRQARVGDVAVWRCAPNNGYGPMNLGCAACTFENITWHAMPADRGLREMSGPGGNVYRRCRLVPCPPEDDPVTRELPRFRSGSHEAFNSRGMMRGPVCDFCETLYHTDDDININGGYWFVVAAEGDRVRALCTDLYAEAFVCGPVQLMMADGTVPVDLPEVVSCQRASKPTPEEVKLVLASGLNYHLPKKMNYAFEFRLSRPDARFRPGSAFVPQNAGGNGFRFANCVFGRNRARGIILNASDGVVENCVFERTAGQGIRASASYPWLEGGCCRNVTIRDCTFIDVDCYVGAVIGGNRILPAEGHRDLVIRDNVFRGKAKLVIEGCTGLTLEGNQFDIGEKKGQSLTNVKR